MREQISNQKAIKAPQCFCRSTIKNVVDKLFLQKDDLDIPSHLYINSVFAIQSFEPDRCDLGRKLMVAKPVLNKLPDTIGTLLQLTFR